MGAACEFNHARNSASLKRGATSAAQGDGIGATATGSFHATVCQWERPKALAPIPGLLALLHILPPCSQAAAEGGSGA
eukprot:CAMPEP_0202379956 /NCGR_PEP_ID=MMETSP1127-20130417/26436_1 /ASSEMBLY_ACC=CAM_ASM_000462 /TAXON_ID=3047 /ORGANISM="Dunaliella tertiolecta, Strain CCMP1320" /LENGTH=77 /DNA_ID=CAMNT_0048978575 /DNA_START=43 /DNA_END=272 /DNA_ORIENTATION=+